MRPAGGPAHPSPRRAPEVRAPSPAQLNYADMLKRVEPLRNELQKLEGDAKDNQKKANEVERMIRDLEASIARYKEEYAVLISEAQAIKADLAAVEAKVSPRGPAPGAPARHSPGKRHALPGVRPARFPPR